MKLSLIIPIYNAESFLPRLFENIEAQDLFKDDEELGEVIFVNDESPDHSAEVIKEYRKRHPNWVRLISQKNQGQHIARNTGILAAKGDYIAFMDQDDAYTLGGLSILLDTALKNDVDIVRGCAKWPEDESFLDWKTYLNDKLEGVTRYNGWDFIIRTNGLCYTTMVWCSVYRRKFIIENNILFPKDVRYFEDGAYNWELMLHNPSVVTISNIVYLWIQRPQSESHNDSMDHRARRESMAEQLAVFMLGLYRNYETNVALPLAIKLMLKEVYYWTCYKYLGTLVKFRGLTKGEIEPTIKRLKEEGVYPYPHRFPKDLPEGYPTSLRYRVMWRLMSYEWILKLMLRLRTRKVPLNLPNSQLSVNRPNKN